MNDFEKTYEAFRMTPWLCDCYKEWKPKIDDKFRRGTKFPYIQRGMTKDDKGNEWFFVFMCPSKAMKKKGCYLTMAYMPYTIPPKRKEHDTNSGTGCMMMDFITMKDRIDGLNPRGAYLIMDIVPHAVNRYTERYLRPNGKEGYDFHKKIEDMLLRWQWFDIDADRHGDVNAQKHMEGNICPYDVIMRGGGMLRGQVVDNTLLRFTTYVSDEMMFDGQKERHQEMINEFYRLKRSRII